MVACKILGQLSVLLKLVAEHLYAILVLIHASHIIGLIDLYHNSVNILTNIVPGLLHFFQIILQVLLFESRLLAALLMLFSEVGEVVFSHFIDDCADFSVEIVEQGFLLLVVPVDLLGVDGAALVFNGDDFFEKFHDLFVSDVVGVVGHVGQGSVYFIAFF